MLDTTLEITMNCRKGCGACCIAISISSPLPGMPDGKPARIRCVHLSDENICTIHAHEDYPKVCRNLRPSVEMCGYSFGEAIAYLTELEELTAPAHNDKKQPKGVIV